MTVSRLYPPKCLKRWARTTFARSFGVIARRCANGWSREADLPRDSEQDMTSRTGLFRRAVQSPWLPRTGLPAGHLWHSFSFMLRRALQQSGMIFRNFDWADQRRDL